jgi:hypothetical protein
MHTSNLRNDFNLDMQYVLLWKKKFERNVGLWKPHSVIVIFVAYLFYGYTNKHLLFLISI